MDWHYTQNDETIGPVTEDEIKDLIAKGTINADTMVWNSSFSDWQALSATDLASLLSTSSADVALDANTAVCSMCSKSFPQDELVSIAGHNSCAECKPLALRRFQENSATYTGLLYAGFWIRVGSTMLDGIILWPINMFVLLILHQ